MDTQSQSSDIAIQVSHLTKVYDTAVMRSAAGEKDFSEPVRPERPLPAPPATRSFTALEDLSFDLCRGDVLGIIGRNGSGKSTLLKILSEVLPPTSGEVRIRGRVASLIEVGTGFHPDITGRENIFMNGILLGMDRATISRKFDEIVHFSGIGDFIDVPVKKYSSGMFLRLAFSVMVSLDNNILLLDEVLSVGDADFRLKSYNRIKSLRGTDRAIIIVSHDLSAISDLCNKCLVLDKGKMVSYGETTAILSRYMENAVIDYMDEKREGERQASEITADGPAEERKRGEGKLQSSVDYTGSLSGPGDDRFRIIRMSVSAKGKPADAAIMMDDEIELSYTCQKNFARKTVPGILITSPLWGSVMALTSERPEPGSGYCSDEGVGLFTSMCTIPASFLNAGIYGVTLYFNLDDEADTLILNVDEALNFKVNYSAYNVPPSTFIYKGRFRGPVYPLSSWQIRQGLTAYK